MKFGAIQFLRAIAAILIVYAHSIDLTMKFGKSHQQSFYYLNNIGFIGTDLFFVISGFIIAYSANKYVGAKQGFHFLQRRFIRINPIYYIASFVFFGMQFIFAWATNYPNTFLFELNIIPGFVDTLWVIPTADKVSHYKPYLPIGWTLAYEWLFYLLFFTTILIKVRRKTLLLTSIIGLLALAGRLANPADLRLAFVTNAILLEFLLGVAIYKVYVQAKRISIRVSIALLLAGVGSLIGLVFYNYGNISITQTILTGTLSLNRTLLWGIPSGCIVAGCVFLEKNGHLQRVWNNRICRLVGDASYSICLVHLTVFTALTILYHHINTLLLPDISIFLQVVIAVVAGILVYLYMEKPFLKWLRRLSQRTTSLNTSSAQPQSA